MQEAKEAAAREKEESKRAQRASEQAKQAFRDNILKC